MVFGYSFFRSNPVWAYSFLTVSFAEFKPVACVQGYLTIPQRRVWRDAGQKLRAIEEQEDQPSANPAIPIFNGM